MKVITLQQPWKSLVAIGMKTVVTRPYPTSYVGPLTIYAANTVITKNDDPYLRSVLASAGHSIKSLPLGVAMATGNLVDCQKIATINIPCYPKYAFSDFKEGWYALELAGINSITHRIREKTMADK